MVIQGLGNVGSYTGKISQDEGKVGPGYLGRVIFARDGGGGGSATVLLYDGLSAVNPVGKIDTKKDVSIQIPFDFIFNIGLFVVITGGGTLGTTITFD